MLSPLFADLFAPATTEDISSLRAGAGVPSGYTRTTYNGVPQTFNGAPVFDDGKNFYYMGAS